LFLFERIKTHLKPICYNLQYITEYQLYILKTILFSMIIAKLFYFI